MKNVTLSLVRRRLDAIALDQLRAEAARLASANDALREEAFLAEESAEFWRREATNLHFQLCDARGGKPGITQDGHLVVAHA